MKRRVYPEAPCINARVLKFSGTLYTYVCVRIYRYAIKRITRVKFIIFTHAFEFFLTLLRERTDDCLKFFERKEDNPTTVPLDMTSDAS